jgi:hypothetical protein
MQPNTPLPDDDPERAGAGRRPDAGEDQRPSIREDDTNVEQENEGDENEDGVE